MDLLTTSKFRDHGETTGFAKLSDARLRAIARKEVAREICTRG